MVDGETVGVEAGDGVGRDNVVESHGTAFAARTINSPANCSSPYAVAGTIRESPLDAMSREPAGA